MALDRGSTNSQGGVKTDRLRGLLVTQRMKPITTKHPHEYRY